MTTDDLNINKNIKYDHRNLITELQNGSLTKNDSIIYYTYYRYDESGNRFSKTVYKYTGTVEPTETPEDETESFDWDLFNVEIYSRDVSGREMAIYKNDTLLEYPVYGLDMIGKIKDDEVYFYMKDHLGSVRAVLNSTGGLVSAQDYDAWGYLLQDRVYESSDSKFKFTGKERDDESKYDYFGARFYDARIGRWGQVEPLLDKYPSLTPYNYSLDNPQNLIDPNGKDPRRDQLVSIDQVINFIEANQGKSYWELGAAFGQSENTRYIYLEKQGFIDLQHFFAAAEISSYFGIDVALKAGEGVESSQQIIGSKSSWDPEDLPSNKLGAIFGSEISGNRNNIDVGKFEQYILEQNPLDPNDPKIAEDKLFIARNSEEERNFPLPQKTNYKPYYGENPNYIENFIKYGPPTNFPTP